ncbi:MAG: PDZ domain-containing protein [Chloroflexi bacterium]|nr:PDZ domain-containing protein [Chloroflexota bacterium]
MMESFNKKRFFPHGTVAIFATVVALVAILVSQQGPVEGGTGVLPAVSNDPRRPIPVGISKMEETQRPYLGITYLPLTPVIAARHGLAVQEGAWITAVARNSPAERAGLLPEDVVVAFDGIPLDSMCNLIELLSLHKAGDRVRLIVVRQQQQLTVEVVLGSRMPW